MPAERTSARNRQALLLGLLGRRHLRPDAAGDAAGGGRFRSAVRHGGALAGGGGAGSPSRCSGRGRSRRCAASGRGSPRSPAFSIIGFPLLMAIAMQYAPASHGAVVLAVLPLLTAMAGALVAGERPSLGFWACGVAGTGSVLVYSLLAGGAVRRPALGRSAARRVRRLPRPWPTRSAARWRAASAAGR